MSETGSEDDWVGCHEQDWDGSLDVVCCDNALIHSGNLILSHVA